MIHLCPDLFLVRPGVDPRDESLLTLHLAPPAAAPLARKATEKSGRVNETGGDSTQGERMLDESAADGGEGEREGSARTPAYTPRKRHRASFEHKDLKQVPTVHGCVGG